MPLGLKQGGPDDPESDAFWDHARVMFLGATASVVRESFLAGIETMPSAFEPGFIDQETLRITRDYTDEWWGRLEASTRRTLRQAIITWQTTGLGKRGLPDLIDAIEPLFGRKRAEAIAVTEVTRLFAEGSFANMRGSPAGIQKWHWQTAEDERVEGICIANSAGGPYPMGGGPSFPGHVRCRCYPVAVMP